MVVENILPAPEPRMSREELWQFLASQGMSPQQIEQYLEWQQVSSQQPPDDAYVFWERAADPSVILTGPTTSEIPLGQIPSSDDVPFVFLTDDPSVILTGPTTSEIPLGQIPSSDDVPNNAPSPLILSEVPLVRAPLPDISPIVSDALEPILFDQHYQQIRESLPEPIRPQLDEYIMSLLHPESYK